MFTNIVYILLPGVAERGILEDREQPRVGQVKEPDSGCCSEREPDSARHWQVDQTTRPVERGQDTDHIMNIQNTTSKKHPKCIKTAGS